MSHEALSGHTCKSSFLPSFLPIACCTAPAVKGELSSLPSAKGGAAPLPEVPAVLDETVGATFL